LNVARISYSDLVRHWRNHNRARQKLTPPTTYGALDRTWS